MLTMNINEKKYHFAFLWIFEWKNFFNSKINIKTYTFHCIEFCVELYP